MTVPDWQQPLPRTITVPEVQERRNVKRIHQKGRLAAKSSRKESDSNRTYRGIKMPHAQVTIPNEIPTQSRRSQLSLDNPEIHSCCW
jgi:hypothetical protein